MHVIELRTPEGKVLGQCEAVLDNPLKWVDKGTQIPDVYQLSLVVMDLLISPESTTEWLKANGHPTKGMYKLVTVNTVTKRDMQVLDFGFF